MCRCESGPVDEPGTVSCAALLLIPWGPAQEYDLVVIGSGPGGQKAAIASAKLGKSVAAIEHGQMLGGLCAQTGTIPSKTLREAVLYLTGMSQRELYGASYRVKEKITPSVCSPAPSTSAGKWTWCAISVNKVRALNESRH